MEWIQVGSLIKPFGLKGEMKVYSMTDFAQQRFAPGNVVYLETPSGKEPFEIATYRYHKDQPLISFKNYQDINLIEKYSRSPIYVKRADLHQLPAGEYYFFELKGLEVIDRRANVVGTVLQVEEGAASNLLRIKTCEGKEALIPYVPAFIKKVDLEAKRIIVELIEGLI